jgi:UDP-N-acetylmuramate: L-alanyl-gamma-D-glutamyl-meso-diaminopimelate ligase
MAALNPGFMVGGILKNLNRNYNIGSGPYFVIEGDEYDTAFFDKGPKFLHYAPSRAILTSVEFDHADIYRDFDHVKEAFTDFVKAMPDDALLVACDEVPVLEELTAEASCWVVTYGFRETSPWRLENVTFDPPWTHLEVTLRGEPFGHFKLPLMGRHNALNALAVIAVAHDLRIPTEVIAKAFETLEGIKRRQEVRGIKRDVTIIDDFAHHPTEVKETLAAARAFYKGSRLIAVFEPRTNSSRRKVFQGIYPECFDDAHMVCIRKPPLLDKIPAEERFSSEHLTRDLESRGKKAFCFQDTDAIVDHLVEVAEPKDVILIMSNGGFDNIHEKLLERL